MLETKLNNIKKFFLSSLIPLFIGCSSSGYMNEVYYHPDKKIEIAQDTIKSKKFYDFQNSVYSSSFGMDYDNDGIINYDDPLPYRYGPFIDMNGNGVVDFGDVQVYDFTNNFFDFWLFYPNYRWIGNNPNPWRNYYIYNWNFYYSSILNRDSNNNDFVVRRRDVNTTLYSPRKDTAQSSRETVRRGSNENYRGTINNRREKEENVYGRRNLPNTYSAPKQDVQPSSRRTPSTISTRRENENSNSRNTQSSSDRRSTGSSNSSTRKR